MAPGKSGNKLSKIRAGLVAVLLAVNLALLVSSYFLPFMKTSTLVFFSTDYSLLSGISRMFEEGHFFLGIVIFLFSIVFPGGKLAVLVCIWSLPMPGAQRQTFLRVFSTLGKWSMLDVFLVTLLILSISAKGAAEAEPMAGVYLFTVAIVMSMILTQYIRRHVQSPAATESGPA